MPESPPSSAASPPSGIIPALTALRASLRLRLVTARILSLVALLVAAAVVLGLIDYLVRLPDWIRWIHWFVGLAAAASLSRRFVRPAWRFRPALSDLALHVEHRRPALRGLLASAVDFAQHPQSPDASTTAQGSKYHVAPALALTAVRRAETLWRTATTPGLTQNRSLIQSGGSLATVLAGALGLLSLSPTLWTIGALRLAAPWAGVAWPKLTGVVDMTEGAVHARGTALALQAAVIKSNRPWDSTYVAARYRLVTGQTRSSERRELLTWQEREVETPFAEPGALFERLIEPAADAIEFRFETDDDATDWRRIDLVPPPAVVDATAVVTPPAYASELIAAGEESASRAAPITALLGPGTDDRAVAPPSLAGSAVELTITLNKPVEMPESVAEVFAVEGAGPDTPSPARISRDGVNWRIAWTLDDSLRLPIRLRDEYGIESIEEAVYRFEALVDRPAAATITEPGADRTILPTAVVPVIAEGRDDVGLSWVALEQTIWTPAGAAEPSGPGGALEQRGDPFESARAIAQGRSIASASVEMDLAPLDLTPGDEVRLTALAIDVRGAATDGVTPTRSAPRTLRVISEAQFVEEVQRALAEVRQAAIRVDEQQGDLREQTQTGRADIAVRRGQGAVTDRLLRQTDTVDRLLDRVKENRVEDRGLEELLTRARTSINDAGQASAGASESLQRAAERRAGESSTEEPSHPTPSSPEKPPLNEPPREEADVPRIPSSSSQPSASSSAATPPPGGSSSNDADTATSASPPLPSSAPSSAENPPLNEPPSEEADGPAGTPEPPKTDDQDLQDAAAHQQEVQDELRALIELLDRGEDNWLARNTIERLAREQKALRGQTRQAGRHTAGKSPDQLTADQRSELDKIVEKQTNLADQTAELARDLRQREQALREKDPAAAQGMAAAARRAEQSQVSQTMRNAASEASQNQTARASRQQQQAEEALEEMLEDLDRVDKARDEVLRRELASIIESLEGLVRMQEDQIAALDEASRARKGLAALDEGMIRLNQNTLGTLDLIKESGPEAAPIATLVSRAADAQSGAITEIRRPVMGEPMVRDYETRSLGLLMQALEKAKEVDRAAAERERRKKLGELKKAYREILERQAAVREETSPLALIRELSRRDRQLARALAERQDVIGADLKELLTQTSELQEAKVFDYAHVRMDALSRRSKESLEGASAAAALAAQDSLIKTLKDVLESLNDPKPDEQKFSEGANPGGGGGGASGERMIPPVKELMLLRRLQTDLADRTIDASRIPDGPPRTILDDLSQSQRELMNVGKEFVDRMKQREPAGEAPPPPSPVEPEAPEEEPPLEH
jgi:hypothetical protein